MTPREEIKALSITKKSNPAGVQEQIDEDFVFLNKDSAFRMIDKIKQLGVSK